MNAVRRFLAANERLSFRLNDWARRRTGRRCGMGAFREELIPGLLRPGLRVLDVGGGKHPLIGRETKEALGLSVVGLDISADELMQAPAGCYDATVVGDVATAVLDRPFDLIVSHTVLEHVRDTPAAIANLGAALAPGGVMAHFLPCGWAGFALASRSLGNRLGRSLLWTVYPERRRTSGFPAYYNQCTPHGMRQLCVRAGLEVVETRPYFMSDYLRFLAPLYALEVGRQILLMRLGLENFSETFIVIARKPAAPPVQAAAA